MKPWNEMTREERTEVVVGLIEREDMSYGEIALTYGVSRNVIAGLICRYKERGGVLINRRQTVLGQFYEAPAKRARAMTEDELRKAEEKKLLRKRVQERNALERQVAAQRQPHGRELTASPFTPKARLSVPPPLGLHVMDLTARTCRWPQGTGPYSFCGAATHRNAYGREVYCEYHNNQAYRSYDPKPVNRDALNKPNGKAFRFGSADPVRREPNRENWG
jgi:hypothetical protein